MKKYEKHLVRRDCEWKIAKDEKMLGMLEDMPDEEKGLFMSTFLVEESGYTFIPEETLREFQDVIMKYYFLYDGLKDEKI